MNINDLIAIVKKKVNQWN